MVPVKIFSEFYVNVAVSATVATIAHLVEGKGIRFVILDSLGECERMLSKVSCFLELAGVKDKLMILPNPHAEENSDAENFDLICEKIATFRAVQRGEDVIVLTTSDAIFSDVPSFDEKTFLELSVGKKISISDLNRKLVEFGYYNEVLCEGVGQFAIRGGIVDIYPIGSSTPYRLDFFGDEIESIREFDPNSQLRDGEDIDKIHIESSVYANLKRVVFFETIPNVKAKWIFVEPKFLAEKFTKNFYIEEIKHADENNFQTILNLRKGDKFIGISSFDFGEEFFLEKIDKKKIESEDLSNYRTIPTHIDLGIEYYESERESRLKFFETLRKLKNDGYQLFVESENDSEFQRINEMFAESGFKDLNVFSVKNFGSGFIISFAVDFKLGWKEIYKDSKGVVFISSMELFGRRNRINLSPRKRILSRKAEIDTLLDFSEISEGDYLVHLGYGICRYLGLTTLELDGIKQELLKLEFDSGRFLYLPLHKSHLVSRYIGLDKKSPRLAKLDSKAWIKVRADAEAAAFDYASELLDIQSKRSIASGYSFPDDDHWQNNFEDSFIFTETSDQITAIRETKEDMQSDRAMDRLICADVGFGKTEVALRAAFKAAMAGKQVAILCPTTILCQQHFKTFRERMAPYPIIVEMLSRFRTAKQSSIIKKELNKGAIDIIIGTHALLADSVIFKDLGLLVIDEEHRFGVKHKERMKKMKENIDVLSMSATPIPRTLYFAMMGARTISLIETPPKNRFPVETIVKEYSENDVRIAVEREIERGGQVFYLHNFVKTINETAERLEKLFPNLRIGVGHGKLSEKSLEKLMADFVEGKYDILVCTTIIETGLDIPNCNTIIIEGADRFGLSQLYQLRGRVGRFTRRAYAWLFLHKHAKILDVARKRLGAIRQYNKPGAGFRLATRDLQLRGCGNLLGARQSGHIAGVGFDMYCSLLKQSIARLKGDKTASHIRASVNLDFVRLGEGNKSLKDEFYRGATNIYNEMRMREIEETVGEILTASIPKSYIPQSTLRIDIYRRLELCPSIDELKRIRKEILDRYGKIPDSVELLCDINEIRILAELEGISKVESEGDKLKLKLANSKDGDFIKLNGHFPRLTKRNSTAKVSEIKNFLLRILKTIK